MYMYRAKGNLLELYGTPIDEVLRARKAGAHCSNFFTFLKNLLTATITRFYVNVEHIRMSHDNFVDPFTVLFIKNFALLKSFIEKYPSNTRYYNEKLETSLNYRTTINNISGKSNTISPTCNIL